MHLLVDTQSYLWLGLDPRSLSAAATEAARNPSNTLFVSIATLWEIAIKVSIGKLPLPTMIAAFIAGQESPGFTTLPVTEAHTLVASALPLIHRDPFDRMLVAQARVEGVAFVANDGLIVQYGVPVLW